MASASGSSSSPISGLDWISSFKKQSSQLGVSTSRVSIQMGVIDFSHLEQNHIELTLITPLVPGRGLSNNFIETDVCSSKSDSLLSI